MMPSHLHFRTTSITAVVITIALILLEGCAGKTHIYSEPNSKFARPLQRVLVIAYFDRVAGRQVAEAMETALVSEFGSRGVYASVNSPIDRTPEEFRRMVHALSIEHSAREILFFDFEGGSQNIAGVYMDAHYKATILDLENNRQIWRAQVKWSPGSRVRSTDDRTDPFVSVLMEALTKDGLLRSPKLAILKASNCSIQPTPTNGCS